VIPQTSSWNLRRDERQGGKKREKGKKKGKGKEEKGRGEKDVRRGYKRGMKGKKVKGGAPTQFKFLATPLHCPMTHLERTCQCCRHASGSGMLG